MPVIDGIIKPIANGDLESWWGAHGTGNLTAVNCAVMGEVQFNRRAAAALVAVWQSLSDAGLGHLVDMQDWAASGGTWNDRPIAGTDLWSPHAYGCAIDINTNHVGNLATGQEWIAESGSNYKCDPALIAPSLHTLAPYFHAWGFSWGGEWSGYIDPMHYEATELTCALLEGTALDAEAQAVIDAARAAIGSGLGVVWLDASGGGLIPCHPALQGDETVVDLRATAEALGATVTWAADGVHVFLGAREVDTAGWTVSEGETARCPLRQVVGALGWAVKEPVHLEATPPRIYVEKAG
jgi:hypothetical protein